MAGLPDAHAGASSLDSAAVRIWSRRTWSGAVYLVETSDLAGDVAVAVRIAKERWRLQAVQRRRRLLKWALPGVEKRIEAGRQVRLLTLPYPNANMAELAQAWQALRHRIVRRTGELEFCGTRAIGRINGNPHAHVLCDWGQAWLSQEWLSAAWESITGYAVVDVRAVKSSEAARYVAANVSGYISEQAGGRMFRSRNWL